jgi:hypothetical protein
MPSITRGLRPLVPFFVASLVACAEEPPPVAPPAPSATPAPADSAAAAPPTAAPAVEAPKEEGHRYLVSVAACWFGGLWGLTDGESSESRKEAHQARCHEVVKGTYGSDDLAHYEKLRALEAGEVDKVATRLEGLAGRDPVDAPRKEALVKVLRAFAEAQRENLFARRAADKIKRDLAGDKEPTKLTKDEVDAVEPLRAHKGLEALFNLASAGGDLGPEAHALAVLTAMDRMSDARGLPKHMKIHAVGAAFGLLFGVAAPDTPSDATKPLKPGAWLAYLSDVARAAGHPVPDTAKTPKEREPFAWGGVLAGFADKLEADAPRVAATTDLSKLVPVVARRLKQEYADIVATAPPAKAAGKK